MVARPDVAPGPHPDVAVEQAGVFTRSQARAAGWSDDVQRRLIREGVWVAVAGSVMRERTLEVGPWQRAFSVALSGGVVVSHCTAAQLWGLAAPDHLHGTSWSVVRARDVTLHRSRLDPGEVERVGGLAVTSPVRTLSDMLRHLPLDHAVAVVTGAFQAGTLRAADLEAAARTARGRWGVDRVRETADSCSREPHSVLEWRFHRVVDRAGADWQFNVDIHDGDGRLIGRVDALHPTSGTVVELDGRAYHGDDRFQPDRTRDQRLAAEGYVVLRLTWQDVTQRELEMIELIRRTIAARGGPPTPGPRLASGPLAGSAVRVGSAGSKRQRSERNSGEGVTGWSA
jgi:hypothetical protein